MHHNTQRSILMKPQPASSPAHGRQEWEAALFVAALLLALVVI